MRKAFNVIGLALALLLAFSSCQKAPFLTFTGQKSFTFKDAGGSETITFSCNRAWTVTSSESWLTVSPAKGDANEEGARVTITCAANTTYDPRSATVTISSEGMSESISIAQETNYGLIVSPTTFNLTNAEQDIDIEVQKNVQYSVAIDKECSDWISIGGTKALTTDKVTIHIATNTSYDDREGKITFKRIDGDLSQTVIIKQSQTDGIIIEKTEYDVVWKGGSVEVAVKANVEFEVVPEKEWVHFVQTKALSSSTITLIVDKNDTYEARESSVTFRKKDGDLSADIIINQDGQIAVSSVILNKTETSLLVGKYEVLVAEVLPENATDDKTIYWSSSDETIAIVENGKITAISEGSAVITAKVGKVEAECTVHVFTLPDKAIPGLFSISSNKQVFFSHGNLQAFFNGNSYNWGFAAHQYDYIGNAAGNTTKDYQISGGIVDLFCWSTPATNYGINPSERKATYHGDFKDWGEAIDNNNTSHWRTLSKDEWRYLLFDRSDASIKVGYAIVCGVNGLILLPDTFLDPMKNNGSSAFVPKSTSGWTANIYTSGDNWNTMESAGAVFLPAAGSCHGLEVFNVGDFGGYWSSTPDSIDSALELLFGIDLVSPPENGTIRSYGRSVRLVTDAYSK